MSTPPPRDVIDHLRELTAIVETLRVAVGSLAAAVPQRATVLREYDQGVAHLEAVSLGQAHSERYLAYLAEHTRKTRRFLSEQALR